MAKTYQSFPPSLLTLSPRLTRVGDPSASVLGINTTPLPDGALVYCLENKGEYQLDKQDSTSSANGNTIIAPTTGPGRWLRRLPASGASGLLWRPDGLGDVQTWAEVMAVVAAGNTPLTVYVTQVGITYSIPAGSYDTKGLTFEAPRNPNATITVQIEDAATLRPRSGR